MTVGEQPRQDQLEHGSLADDGPLDLVDDRRGACRRVGERERLVAGPGHRASSSATSACGSIGAGSFEARLARHRPRHRTEAGERSQILEGVLTDLDAVVAAQAVAHDPAHGAVGGPAPEARAPRGW